MIYDLRAFCFKAAPSVWFWKLWHSGSCEWNSDDVAADVTDTADDAGAGRKSAPGLMVSCGLRGRMTKTVLEEAARCEILGCDSGVQGASQSARRSVPTS